MGVSSGLGCIERNTVKGLSLSRTVLLASIIGRCSRVMLCDANVAEVGFVPGYLGSRVCDAIEDTD